MATALDELLSDVLIDAPRCSEPVASRALRDACIQFYKLSHIKRVELTAIDVLADTAAYALTNPAGYQIHELHDAELEEAPMFITTKAELDMDWPTVARELVMSMGETNPNVPDSSKHWRYYTQDRPGAVFMATPNRVQLVGKPTTAFNDSLILTVSVYPTLDVTEIEDDWIFEGHNRAIVEGALATVLSQARKAWSDPKAAAEHQEEFEVLTEKARGSMIASNRGSQTQTLRVKPSCL